MSSIPVPEEIKPFTKNVIYDPSRDTVIVTISAKLFFTTILSNLQDRKFMITQVVKNNEKVYIYTKVDIKLPEPFESFDGRIAISQAKLDRLLLDEFQKQVKDVMLYYRQDNDDLLILVEIPVNRGAVVEENKSEPKIPW